VGSFEATSTSLKTFQTLHGDEFEACTPLHFPSTAAHLVFLLYFSLFLSIIHTLQRALFSAHRRPATRGRVEKEE
jgi:hypothetical protein